LIDSNAYYAAVYRQVGLSSSFCRLSSIRRRATVADSSVATSTSPSSCPFVLYSTFNRKSVYNKWFPVSVISISWSCARPDRIWQSSVSKTVVIQNKWLSDKGRDIISLRINP